MTDSCNSSYNSIKISEFPFSAKNKNPTKEIIYFSKDFSYLLIIPSTKSHLVTYLALY